MFVVLAITAVDLDIIFLIATRKRRMRAITNILREIKVIMTALPKTKVKVNEEKGMVGIEIYHSPIGGLRQSTENI